MKKTVFIASVVLLIAAAGSAVYFLAPSAPKESQLNAQLAKTRSDLAKVKAELEQMVKQSQKKDIASEPATAPLNTAAKTEPPAANAAASTGGAAVKDMMHKQSQVQVDLTYGRLFQKLSLNDQEQANFHQLLADRLTTQADLRTKLMDPSLSLAGRRAVSDQMAAQKAQSDANIRKFLNNDDDYNTYQSWEATQQERMLLQVAGSSFDMAGSPLADDQREQLVNAMAAARNDPSLYGSNDPRNVGPQSLTPEGIAKQLQVHDAQDARVLKDSEAFLNPQQMEALKKMQQQIRTLTEAGMRSFGKTYGVGGR